MYPRNQPTAAGREQDLLRRHQATRDYLIASVLAVSCYVAGAALFKVDNGPRAADKKATRSLATITMLPIERTPAFNWQRNLIASLDLLDPTIMSLPNATFGFSGARSLEDELPIQDPSPVEFTFRQSTNPSPPEIAITPPPPSSAPLLIEEDLNAAWATQATQEPPPMEPRVYWTDDSGTAVPRMPDLDLGAIAAGDTPIVTSGPTRLRVLSQVASVRVRIVQSCGQPALDQLAVRQLRNYLAIMAAKGESMPTGDSSGAYYAHWRWLPFVQEKKVFDTEEWHDQYWF